MNDSKPLSAVEMDTEKDLESEKHGRHGFVEEPVVTVIEIDPEMERRVKRKIDTVILPIFGLIFMFQYLDKVRQHRSFAIGRFLLPGLLDCVELCRHLWDEDRPKPARSGLLLV
jgi:hypothetical protein